MVAAIVAVLGSLLLVARGAAGTGSKVSLGIGVLLMLGSIAVSSSEQDVSRACCLLATIASRPSDSPVATRPSLLVCCWRAWRLPASPS
ncbi:MAG: hypothetical protein U0Q11_05070 [Vicinamibacterales bacterium]